MNMNYKKTKITTILILGSLLLVPFMRLSRAQVPTHIGVVVGQHEEWDANIYSADWTQWDADNMTSRWAEAFGHTYIDNMTAVKDTAAKVPLLPQATMFFTVDSIIPDTDGFDLNSDSGITADETWASPGNTLVNMTTDSGTFMDFGGWPYYDYFPNGTGIFIANTTEGFAEDTGYGAMYSSLIWATNLFNSGNIGYLGAEYDANMSNTIFFAPNNVNWTEFADECNLWLALSIWFDTGYSIKFENITDGFMMSSSPGDFNQNTENINVTATYDSNGLLTFYEMRYGNDVLVDMAYADSDYPVVTDASSDFTVDHDYTGVTINWTATDTNPDEYAILRNDTAVVFPIAWSSGVEIQYAVPDGLAPGTHVFKINFGDTRPNRPNVASDTVVMTVNAAPTPPAPDGIPGYEPLLVIGFLTVATAGIIYITKKKLK